MKRENKLDEFWVQWNQELPAPLPGNFAFETMIRARQAKQALQAQRLFQVGAVCAILLAGLIGGTISRHHSHQSLPPGLSLFHVESSKFVVIHP